MSELLTLPVEVIAARVRGGEVSATEMIEASLGRIAEVDSRLGAFLGIEADEALASAGAIDARRRRGEASQARLGNQLACRRNVDDLD